MAKHLDGAVVDLPAHKVQLLGGSDKDGVPMRSNVHGGVRRAVVLSGGAGFKAHKKGERRRKTVRGDIITDEIAQINMKIVERPAQAAAPAAKPRASSAISLIFLLTACLNLINFIFNSFYSFQ